MFMFSYLWRTKMIKRWENGPLGGGSAVKKVLIFSMTL